MSNNDSPKRAIILVLDSFGLGATADADKFGDVGADTFGHIAEARARSAAGPIQLPNLGKLGLFHAAEESSGVFHPGYDPETPLVGAYGHAAELSSGKDTPSGHWEIAGVPVLFDWGYFSASDRAAEIVPMGTMGVPTPLRVLAAATRVADAVRQIGTPRSPDPIMRRPCADREEKRETHGRDNSRRTERRTETDPKKHGAA